MMCSPIMSAEEHLGVQFHGTAGVYAHGDVIDPSKPHKRVNMGHANRVYTTSSVTSARDYASSAAQEANWNGKFGPQLSYEGPHAPHVYEVTHLGSPEQDNATTHGMMSRHPIRIEREV